MREPAGQQDLGEGPYLGDIPDTSASRDRIRSYFEIIAQYMRVAKSFGWESAHRLPNHNGLCRNLHGHSYRMTVSVEGDPDEHGIVIDFQDIKGLVRPLVDAWDHATLISESDTQLLGLLQKLGDRFVVLPFDTTAENMCAYVADYVLREGRPLLKDHRIRAVIVRIHETESCYAEHAVTVD